MSAQITQHDRVAVARHLRQWSLARNIPQTQIDRMVNDLLAGHHDAQIQQAAPPNQPYSMEQQPPIVNPVPSYGTQMPLGTFLVPQCLPPAVMQMVPLLLPVQAAIASNRRPSPTFLSTDPAPVTLVARTTIPGGAESIQHDTFHSGQQGNITLSYSSSSTLTTFPASTHHVVLPTPMISPMHELLPAPSIAPAPTPLPAAISPVVPASPPPRVATAASVPLQVPTFAVPGPQIVATHHAALSQAPQNPRLARAFGQQLGQQTYFSKPLGLPDRSVRR